MQMVGLCPPEQGSAPANLFETAHKVQGTEEIHNHHSFQRAQPVACIRDHGHSDVAATAAAAAAAGSATTPANAPQHEHVDSSGSTGPWSWTCSCK